MCFVLWFSINWNQTLILFLYQDLDLDLPACQFVNQYQHLPVRSFLYNE